MTGTVQDPAARRSFRGTRATHSAEPLVAAEQYYEVGLHLGAVAFILGCARATAGRHPRLRGSVAWTGQPVAPAGRVSFGPPCAALGR